MASASRVTPPSNNPKKKGSAPAPSPNRNFLVLGGLAVVGIAVIAFLVMRPKDVSIPANVTVLAADTAGFRGYILGSDAAPVEISEYADYQCPACGSFEILQFDVIKRQLIDSGLVRWRYRDFPLPQHPHARVAAHATACANDQGKYWELHRAIYDNQAAWSSLRSASDFFRDLAQQAGVELGAYDACMTSAKYAGRIEASVQEGGKLGVGSTPTFLIGGRLYPGVFSSDSLASLVRSMVPKPAP